MSIIDKIKEVNVSELKPYKNNVKHHPSEQIELIKKSINEFGFKVPLLITGDKDIIAGHGRWMAAKELDIKKVPAIIVDDLTEAQIKAFRIADNKVSESAFDLDLLKIELEAIDELDIDISTTGFNSFELESLLGKETNAWDEWEGMPEYESEDKNSIRKIIVHFHTQEAIDAFAVAVEQNITDKTKSIWYPKEQLDEVKDLRY